MLYSEQKECKEIERYLPKEMQFTKEFHPTEEWWDWKENKIHLDAFRNPQAKEKVILF